MEKRILIPVTKAESEKKSIRCADAWGQRTGADLRFLYVRRSIDQTDGVFSLGGMSADSEKKREDDYKEMEQFLGQLDIQSQYSVSVRRGAVSSQIIGEEKNYKPDLLFFSALGDTIVSRLLLDSKTDYSIHHSKCAIFVHKSTELQENNPILVPLDYSEIDRRTIAIADAWACRTDSRLHFLHIAPLPENAQFSGQHVWIEDRVGNRNERRKRTRIKNVSLEERQKMESFLHRVGIASDYSFAIQFGEVNVKILEAQNRLKPKLLLLSTQVQEVGSHAFIGGNIDYLLHYTDCSIYLHKK